jgi:hypothetical protein
LLDEKTRLWPGFSLPANHQGRSIMDMTLGESMEQATKNRPKAVF